MKIKKTESKDSLQNFTKEIIKKPEVIKGGPDGSRGTEVVVKSGTGIL